MAGPRILIVEDSLALAETYKAYLSAMAGSIDLAGCGEDACALVSRVQYDCVVMDVNLPDMSGLDVMDRMRGDGVDSEVIVITANGSISLAVDAMRHGAFDFVVKPFNAERLQKSVANACKRDAAAKRKKAPQTQVMEAAPDRVGDFIGSSAPMQAVYRLLRNAAPTNATVFITGESGTGKELCAEALHRLSKRASGPFVTLNCAAIPKDLLESEIFGHVKGAFSGAVSDRNGAALQADGGTLFLDEIGEMDLSLQSKLLRFLQSHQVQRLGEDKLRTSDVRIVCATNRNPLEEVREGRFREDLFYRLHVIPVELPPLRQRGQDIIEIANGFLKRFAAEDAKAFRRFNDGAKAALLSYSWPGNVRQLQNVVRNMVVLNDGEEITDEMLPLELLGEVQTRLAAPDTAPLRDLLARAAAQDMEDRPIRPLEEVIRTTIEDAIRQCDGSIPRAAVALEVSPSTIYRRIEHWRSEDAA